MTPEQQKYFDDMEFTFGQQGWKNFIEDVKLRQDSEREEVLGPRKTYDDVVRASARNEVYSYILNLEFVLREVKRQLNEQTDLI